MRRFRPDTTQWLAALIVLLILCILYFAIAGCTVVIQRIQAYGDITVSLDAQPRFKVGSPKFGSRPQPIPPAPPPEPPPL